MIPMAHQYDTEAVLLTSRDWGEADKILTFFSRDLGKFTAVAYGVRRGKNPLRGWLQPFAWLDVSIAVKKTVNALDIVQQCAIKQSFRNLREDLAQMAYASFLVELVTEMWPEKEPEPLVFDILTAAFFLLGFRNPKIVSLAAAWQLVMLAGFCPVCDECVVCGEPLHFPAYFNVTAGGGVCSACCQGNLPSYSESVNLFMQQLLQLDLRNPGHFTVSRHTLLQTEGLLISFLACRLDKPLKSLSFIQQALDGDEL